MKAEIGKRYAQIFNGKCHWKFDITTLPEWQDSAFQVVDITGMNPEPAEGDIYDGVMFVTPSAPPGPSPEELAEQQRKSARQAVLDALLDKIEADPTILDRIR